MQSCYSNKIRFGVFSTGPWSRDVTASSSSSPSSWVEDLLFLCLIRCPTLKSSTKASTVRWSRDGSSMEIRKPEKCKSSLLRSNICHYIFDRYFLSVHNGQRCRRPLHEFFVITSWINCTLLHSLLKLYSSCQ